jgi:iron complex outermembrane receptor protein
MDKKKPLYYAISAAAGIGLPFGVLAQEAPVSANAGLALEEVLVTARKRSETLFDAPGAISSIDTRQLDILQMNDARDMLTLVPTAFLTENNAGTARDVNIRGVGTPNLFAEAGVATYIDEVYSSGFISYPTQFYDLERIEVLRGPQGALYGRNAVGGALNVVSARPDAELGGRLRAAAGRYHLTEYEGTLNVPVTADIGARLTGWYTDQNKGEYYNPAVNEYIDANSSQGGRGVFSFTPGDRLDLDLIVEDTEARTPGTNLYFPDSGETKKTVARDDNPRNKFDVTRVAAIGNYDLDIGTFTLVLGTRSYKLTGVEDTDLTADNPFNLGLGQLGKQTTTRSNKVDSDYVELRWLSPQWGKFNYLAGVNYLDESAKGKTFTDLSGLSDGLSGGALPATLGLDNDQSLNSWAVFAEITYDITPTLQAIASARYTEDEKKVDFTYDPSALMSSILGAAQASRENKTFDNFSPGGILAWQPSDTLRVYGKVQTGFRAGGYNFNVGSVDNLPYDDETSINYEIGAKSEFWDGRALVSVDTFFLKQNDVLVPLFDFNSPGPLGGYLDNVAEAETYGVEAEGTVRVLESLTAGFSMGWLDAEFTNGEDALGNDIKGNKLPSSRELTYAVTASYRETIFDNIQLLADVSYTYRDDGYSDLSNTNKVSDASLLNASAGFEYRNVRVLAYVKNALDDDYDLAFGVRAPNDLGVSKAEGETYGVSVVYDF